MATGEKISAQAVATTWSGSDLATIVQSGVNKSITHDVFMDDTQILKAWVRFDGTGTIAIDDDFNVSSLTDEGTGDYTINFTNALTDANFSVSGICGTTSARMITIESVSTTTCRINIHDFGGNASDESIVCSQIFGS